MALEVDSLIAHGFEKTDKEEIEFKNSMQDCTSTRKVLEKMLVSTHLYVILLSLQFSYFLSEMLRISNVW